MNMYSALPRPIIFAHRGSSAHAPENTLAAFDLAVHQKADAIELDAKLTADGQVVIIHDQTVERTTASTGRVKDLSLAALRELDAGSFFDISFQGERIPTLAEVFELVGRRTYINIELTNYDSPFDDLAEKVAELVLAFDLTDRVLFSSFSWFVLRRIHRLLPSIPIGLLAHPGSQGYLARSRLARLMVSYQALHPEIHDVEPDLIRNLQQAGRRVHVYTVNQPSEMARLFSYQIDGIFTDDPILAREILNHSVRVELR